MSINSVAIEHLLICWTEPNKEEFQHETKKYKYYNKSHFSQAIDTSDKNLLIQLIEKLRNVLPNSQLTLLTSWNNLICENLVVQEVSTVTWTFHQTVDWLRQHSFDAALIFTPPTRSPYAMAYACYLAGIPIRVGQSCEFGGGVLSICVTPCDTDSIGDFCWHLLHSSIPILCGSEF
ncbi:glycosyltransferase family 9 protein [Thermocoleostomius sinensis]|uniref:Uncharacterized protein n=1 Tax=Thermocoleostomius sinensis A174 TaxID=2016057 RepID=A0A9E8ZF98_9CYAN|nr:hypothetical protein [Thermocoleostomius sinensis]WAL61746.1 hypothetical protein OXH18_07100 [Thermocoleostomius sinensis A174]